MLSPHCPGIKSIRVWNMRVPPAARGTRVRAVKRIRYSPHRQCMLMSCSNNYYAEDSYSPGNTLGDNAS
uniref:Uncharacterized protein n=1 Tax=Arundo donax TaxID=35708 RepID=A0A0A9FRB7_ARUDO